MAYAAPGPHSLSQQMCCTMARNRLLSMCTLEQGRSRAGSQVQQLARLLAGIQRAAMVGQMYVSARLPSLMVSCHPPNALSSAPAC